MLESNYLFVCLIDCFFAFRYFCLQFVFLFLFTFAFFFLAFSLLLLVLLSFSFCFANQDENTTDRGHERFPALATDNMFLF